MKNAVRTKKIISIVSLAALAGCSAPPQFPNVSVFVVDAGNRVCAEYKLTDPVAIKFKLEAEHPLARCQDVIGFDKRGFKVVQQWARDQIERKCTP